MTGESVECTMAISFTREAMLGIASKMLGEEITELDDEIRNLAGEITNMVTGGAKRMLSEKGIEFDMATPVVVSGKNHTIHHKSKGPVVIIALRAELGKAYIEFSFDE